MNEKSNKNGTENTRNKSVFTRLTDVEFDEIDTYITKNDIKEGMGHFVRNCIKLRIKNQYDDENSSLYDELIEYFKMSIGRMEDMVYGFKNKKDIKKTDVLDILYRTCVMINKEVNKIDRKKLLKEMGLADWKKGKQPNK